MVYDNDRWNAFIAMHPNKWVENDINQAEPSFLNHNFQWIEIPFLSDLNVFKSISGLRHEYANQN